MTTGPIRDSDYRRLDSKVTALLVITGINLIILLLGLLGVLDLATLSVSGPPEGEPLRVTERR